MIDLDALEALAHAAPSGQWEVWTSNSWRRVYADQGRDKVLVIEPTTQRDRWPDLMFGPGVSAWLEGFTPDVALELIAEVRRLRADAERYQWAISREDRAEELYGAVLSNCPDCTAINAEIDGVRAKEGV